MMSEIAERIHTGLELFFEENRRKTFKKWVFSSRDMCNADKMAEAGFVFTGNSIDVDSVKCFMCNKSLDGWESTDDPWEEHKKHSSKCKFAKLQKPMQDLTLKQLMDLKMELMEIIINSYYDEKVEEVTSQFQNYEEEIESEI